MGRKQSERNDLNGLLPVYKPQGMVSKDVSRAIEKHLGRVHIGHVGTLDPVAEGVLPILLGRATRLQDFLLCLPKTYQFKAMFGFATDTLDLDGKKVAEKSFAHVDLPMVEKAVATMLGEISQTPPVFSAVKYKGIPLYQYARADRLSEVPLSELTRKVQIYSFKVISYCQDQGIGEFSVECSKGTYVRTLVHDLAVKLETLATLGHLVRSAASGVQAKDCVPMDVLEKDLAKCGTGTTYGLAAQHLPYLIPMAKIDVGLPKLTPEDAKAIGSLRTGKTIFMDNHRFTGAVSGAIDLNGKDAPLVLADASGHMFGLGSYSRGQNGFMQISLRRGL